MPISRDDARRIKEILSAKKDGNFGFGGGLYLQICDGTASWVLRLKRDGQAYQTGLGSPVTVRLDAARKKAEQARLVG